MQLEKSVMSLLLIKSFDTWESTTNLRASTNPQYNLVQTLARSQSPAYPVKPHLLGDVYQSMPHLQGCCCFSRFLTIASFSCWALLFFKHAQMETKKQNIK